MMRSPRIVLLGMMTKIPVAGVVWQTLHYLDGFRRLGYDVYYIESHARTPSMLMKDEADDGAALAASFIDRTLRRFGFGDRWAYVALHGDGACHGLSSEALARLYRSAALIVNLHGGTAPRPEHAETGRLVYLETDPVQLQVELHDGVRETIDFLEPHVAFFTFAENLGAPDCRLPVSDRFRFLPTRQPVVLEHWPVSDSAAPARFTTVANWKQEWRAVTLEGTRYEWSKHHEFEKVLELPSRFAGELELALSGHNEADAERLRRHGWTVREAAPLSRDIDAYRAYVRASGGEFTVAKDQNVRLRTGWFSDRSATYLAAGRPVVTQDTGAALPTGTGLLVFETLEGAAAALETVAADGVGHARRARELALEHFSHERVLGPLLEHVGLPARAGRELAFPADLDLVAVSRRPTTLVAETLQAVATAPAVAIGGRSSVRPELGVVVVTHDGLVFTRLCIESILAPADDPPYELVVIDNASTDATREYLAALAAADPRVRVVLNETNVGFPAAVNLGLSVTAADLLVLLNNDTIPPPGWLARLSAHLEDPSVGLVGAVTNRIGTAAEVEAPYRTYGELAAYAQQRAAEHAGTATELSMPAMFCVALRREVLETVGPLDERFGLGTLEDDDYALRVRRAGYRTVCAEDVFVHHFGEASFGRLFAGGQHSRLIAENQRRFEEKWGEPWTPYARRRSNGYEAVKRRVREVVATTLRPSGPIIVVSRGDEELVDLSGCEGWHFPQTDGGVYAGHYPADGVEAVEQLEDLRRRGGTFVVFPAPSRWWLDHYDELRSHLAARYTCVVDEEACVVYSLSQERGGRAG